jgi:osmotically-inducible protein OsmY
MILRIVGMLALAGWLAGCSSWVPTVANNGLNYGINVGRAITADRSLFNVLDDLTIKNTINNALLDEALVLNISADVYQGMVMLTGSVQDAETRQKAEALARKVDGVRELFNEIQVTDENWLKFLPKDLWAENILTAKLVFSSEVSSVDYRWRVVNGIVYFMGMARSREELDTVIALARMNGVRKIVSHVFLTDHVIVDVPSAEATASVKPPPQVPDAKPDPEALDTAPKTDETKAKPESKGAKKKPSPRSAAPRIPAP